MAGKAAPSETPQPALDRYAIRVKGHLDAQWSQWFEGLTVTAVEGGDTVLAGPVPDQAALHGLLARVRDLNLTLIGVERLPAETRCLRAGKRRSAPPKKRAGQPPRPRRE